MMACVCRCSDTETDSENNFVHEYSFVDIAKRKNTSIGKIYTEAQILVDPVTTSIWTYNRLNQKLTKNSMSGQALQVKLLMKYSGQCPIYVSSVSGKELLYFG